MWGIARYLYDFDGVWVGIDSKKMIVSGEYAKLDAAYSKFAINYLKTLPLTPQQIQQAEASLQPQTQKTASGNSNQKATGKKQTAQQPMYQVQAAQSDGTATYLQLLSQNGQRFNAVYPKQVSLQPGQVITNVSVIQQMDSKNQAYNLLQHFDIAA